MANKNNSQLVTRTDLRQELDIFKQEVREEIEESNKKYFDKLANMIDPVLKEVVASREERQIEAVRLAEVRDTTEDHETRITNLENLQKAA